MMWSWCIIIVSMCFFCIKVFLKCFRSFGGKMCFYCIIIISIRFTFFKCDCICRTGRQTVTKAIAKIIAH